jgi:hypothetical protein
VVALAVLTSVAGCGGPEQQRADYCAELKHEQARFAEMFGDDDPSALLDNLPVLERVADKAPEDLQDEWQTLLNALHGLDDALDDAGVDPEDFRGGRPPAGLSSGERKSVADAADALAAPQVVSSAQGIEQQARDVCKIQLGL